MSRRQTDDRQAATARRRYDRVAAIYDLLESPMERVGFAGWRGRLWQQVRGPRILEVGVGTGKNFAYYPEGAEVVAVDLSPRMLDQARRRAEREKVKVDLRLMDAQHLEFPNDSFDSVVATFVFCSVPDPVRGLQEVRRVVRPEGKVYLLEHVRPPDFLGRVADALNPLVVRLWGANINRCTEENVERAGHVVERVENLRGGIVKIILARPGKPAAGGRDKQPE